jgi:hypothetical protein
VEMLGKAEDGSGDTGVSGGNNSTLCKWRGRLGIAVGKLGRTGASDERKLHSGKAGEG